MLAWATDAAGIDGPGSTQTAPVSRPDLPGATVPAALPPQANYCRAVGPKRKNNDSRTTPGFFATHKGRSTKQSLAKTGRR